MAKAQVQEKVAWPDANGEGLEAGDPVMVRATILGRHSADVVTIQLPGNSKALVQSSLCVKSKKDLAEAAD